MLSVVFTLLKFDLSRKSNIPNGFRTLWKNIGGYTPKGEPLAKPHDQRGTAAEFGGGILVRKILRGPDLMAMVEYGLLRVNRPPERRQREYECECGHDGAGSYGDG